MNTHDHQPGQWPVPRTPLPELKTEPDRDNHARARFHVTLGALRAALEEQPTPNLVRATGRRWLSAAAQLIDEVAKNVHKDTEEGGE